MNISQQKLDQYRFWGARTEGDDTTMVWPLAKAIAEGEVTAPQAGTTQLKVRDVLKQRFADALDTVRRINQDGRGASHTQRATAINVLCMLGLELLQCSTWQTKLLRIRPEDFGTSLDELFELADAFKVRGKPAFAALAVAS